LGLAYIVLGQKLAFPLPSSWDEVEGEDGHMYLCVTTPSCRRQPQQLLQDKSLQSGWESELDGAE